MTTTTTESELAPLPELEEVPILNTSQLELWAEIKRSSKYFRQGLKQSHSFKPYGSTFDETPVGKPMRFRVRTIYDAPGEYIVRFNGNVYRLADLTLFVRFASGRFLRIH